MSLLWSGYLFTVLGHDTQKLWNSTQTQWHDYHNGLKTIEDSLPLVSVKAMDMYELPVVVQELVQTGLDRWGSKVDIDQVVTYELKLDGLSSQSDNLKAQWMRQFFPISDRLLDKSHQLHMRLDGHFLTWALERLLLIVLLVALGTGTLLLCCYAAESDKMDTNEEEQVNTIPGVQIGQGSWPQAYAQSHGTRREALQLLIMCRIISPLELANNLTIVSQEHIEECISIASGMLKTRPLEEWLQQPQEARRIFEMDILSVAPHRAPSPTADSPRTILQGANESFNSEDGKEPQAVDGGSGPALGKNKSHNRQTSKSSGSGTPRERNVITPPSPAPSLRPQIDCSPSPPLFRVVPGEPSSSGAREIRQPQEMPSKQAPPAAASASSWQGNTKPPQQPQRLYSFGGSRAA